VSDSDIDALVTEVTKGFSNEERRKAVAKRLNAALRTAEHPARPDFPEEWRSEPNVMFDRNDPRPEPFHWGRPNWATEEAYDQDLATFFGNLACPSDLPGAQTRGIARRAILDSDRLFGWRLAARLSGPDCPPAKGLPEDTRRQLEQLAARGNKSTAAPAASPPDPIE
jgi:hypothetical protein